MSAPGSPWQPVVWTRSHPAVWGHSRLKIVLKLIRYLINSADWMASWTHIRVCQKCFALLCEGGQALTWELVWGLILHYVFTPQGDALLPSLLCLFGALILELLSLNRNHTISSVIKSWSLSKWYLWSRFFMFVNRKKLLQWVSWMRHDFKPTLLLHKGVESWAQLCPRHSFIYNRPNLQPITML